jgi:hypothetical protein
MERTGDELLSSATLSRDEDRRRVSREAANLRRNGAHQGRAAGDTRERRGRLVFLQVYSERGKLER